MKYSILMIEDEAAIRDMVRFALDTEQYHFVEAEDTHQGMEYMQQQRPDLILLDWMLPGRSGLEFARQLRRDAQWRDIPLILLTARRDEDDKIAGFEAGADDYITKPFSVRELSARMQSLLRRVGRNNASVDSRLSLDGLVVDTQAHSVSIDGAGLSLGPTEFRLLSYFIQHVDRVFSREQLLNNVWGQDVYIDERTVDVHIRRLRKALQSFGYDKYIQTVRSVGYRFSRVSS